MKITRIILALGFCLAFAADANADSRPKLHDGFHFQAGAGLGYYNVSSDIGQDFSGITIPYQFLLGGTIGPLVIGGGLVLDYAPSPSTDTPGVSSQFIVGIGLYADYYLNPAGDGLHIQGYVGFGGLETSFEGNVGGSDPVGLVTYGGVGYQWFWTDQWSYGVMGRLLYGPFDINGSAFTTIEPAVVGTLTWH